MCKHNFSPFTFHLLPSTSHPISLKNPMTHLIHGFQLIREEKIEESNSLARVYRHVKSGAELLSISNDDENKVFGVTFRTPASSFNGIPHIMEHSVLAGSRKYRTKEPFIELVKGSLQTFLNAFTYPDKTCYPVASQNLQDFYNLIDVYLDAVYYPLIPEHILEQEGWHYELESLEGELAYRGVVFNEMKGAYSSPEALIGRYTAESLFPDSHPYGVDSGGDPRVIPELTYSEFKAFHQRYYHPSNSRIYFYGDDDPTQRLAILDEYLRDFEAIETADTAIAPIPLTAEPRRLNIPYAVDAEQDPAEAKYLLNVNWLLPEMSDTTTTLALAVLSHALSGTAGSPLRKALIDSGLGEDTLGGGFADYLRQPYFSAGLKGVAAENVPAVEELIHTTLQKLATEGIDPQTIQASLNTLEFRLRENNTGSFPRGLAYMLASLDKWLHDGDPLEGLRYEAPLTAVKEAVASGKGYFEGLISHYLLENEHRTTIILEPDPELGQKQEAEEKAKLAAVQASLSQPELERIIERTHALKRIQETPDDPAELAKIPSLALADLERDIKHIPSELSQQDGAEVLYHDLFTNGILYFSVGMNLRVLPQELLPYVPLFGAALTQMGTVDEDYVQLSQRIGLSTGGIGASRFISAQLTSDKAVTWLNLRGKATMPNAAEMLAIMRDVLLGVRLDNQERFRQMVLEEKASEESGLIPGGHGVVLSRLRAHFSEADWVSEIMGGVDYLFFVRDLAQKVDSDWPSVLAKLEEIRTLLVNRANMLCNVTVDGANWALFQPQLADFLASFPTAEPTHRPWQRGELPRHEGLTIPAQVNYVGKAANLYDLGYQHHNSMAVVTNHLRTGYLWEQIRMKGGAYGAFMPFDSYTGVLAMVSYRDPNLLETLAVYDKLADYLANLEMSEDEVTKNIIGVIGGMDAYQLPDAKGYTALTRHLLGITAEYRQQKRDEVLTTTPAHFRELGDWLKAFAANGHIAILGSAEGIAKANEAQGGVLAVQKVL